MMDEHQTFDNMQMYVEYECIKYTPIFAKHGLYYVIKVRKVGESDQKLWLLPMGVYLIK